ncbi:MAG: glycosyltransferase family 39 protein [Victivallales bacterium]|nr:glycosyltransferase family 39 protein [Victivallales bacterium]
MVFFAIVAHAELIWYDDAFSMVSSQYSCIELWDISKYDVHPPTYYYILKTWQCFFGDSIQAAKMMSLCVTLLTAVVMYGIGKEIEGRSFGVCSAIAFLAFPGVCYNAVEIRMYTLTGCMVAVAAFFLVRIVKYPPSFIDYFLFSLSLFGCTALLNAAAVYTATLCSVLLLILLIRKDLRKLVYGLVSTMATGMFLLPLFLFLVLDQCKLVKNDFWTAKFSIGDVFYVFITPYMGRGCLRELSFVCFFLLWAISLTGVFFIFKGNNLQRKKTIMLSMTCVAMPMFLGCVASLCLDRLVFIGRAFYPAVVFLVVLHISALRAIPVKSLRWAGNGLLVVMFLHQIGSYVFDMRNGDEPKMRNEMLVSYKDVPLRCFWVSLGIKLSCLFPQHTIYVDKEYDSKQGFLPFSRNMRTQSLSEIKESRFLFMECGEISDDLKSYLSRHGFIAKLLHSWNSEYSKERYNLFEATRTETKTNGANDE